MEEYIANPLNSNVFFSIGQPIMCILLVFTGIAGLLLLISRLAKLGGLELVAERWAERFLLITLHTGLIWLGLSMVISFVSLSIMDTINGLLLISGAITSIVRRATSDQQKANRTLVITFAFLALAILWTFIFSSVLDALPFQIRDSISDTWRPQFFKDLFSFWHWM